MSADLPHRQPNFYRDGDKVMFHFAVDAGHIVGPRPVSEVDKINHPEAWAAFEAREAAPDPKPAATKPAPAPTPKAKTVAKPKARTRKKA